MAEYFTNVAATYAWNGSEWELFFGPLVGDSTLTDDDAGDDTFAIGENIRETIAVDSDGFGGTVVIDGVTWLIMGDPSDTGQALALYANAPDPGAVTMGSFAVSDVSSNDITVCFAAGTLIATPDGERAVETLEIGDLIKVADGGTVPVKWIGQQTVHKVFTPAERFVPVRVSAGALGDDLPHTDLVLTADHALILDGLAINAGALVNGGSIAYDPIESLPERVTYYHIETANHDVILANGTPAETYVDYVRRSAFDNFQEYVALYGDERTICEMDVPRVSAARLVPPAIKARLNSKDVA